VIVFVPVGREQYQVLVHQAPFVIVASLLETLSIYVIYY